MPAIWPTFGLSFRADNETGTLEPATLEVDEQQSHGGTHEYGIYDGVGIVLNGSFFGNNGSNRTYSCNTLQIRKNLGFANKLRLYVKSDGVDRDIQPETPGATNPGWWAEATPTGQSIRVVWLEHTSRGLTLANGMRAFAGDFTDAETYFGPVFAQATTSFNDYDANRIITVDVESPLFVPTLNSGIWLRDDEVDGGTRITIVGIEINGVLYGQNAEGKTQEDILQESPETPVAGDGWWQDLQNTTQTPSAFDPNVEEYTGATFEQGYNALRDLDAGGASFFDWSDIAVERINTFSGTPSERSSLYNVGWAFSENINSERVEVGDPYLESTVLIWREVAWRLAFEDGQFDRGYYTVKAPPGSTLYDPQVDGWTTGFDDPTKFTNADSPFAVFFVPTYVACYNAYFGGFDDGFGDGTTSAAEDDSRFTTGDANFNFAVGEAYLEGYSHGNGAKTGNFGKIPPGDDD